MLIYSETSKTFIERVRGEIRSLFIKEIEPILPLKFNRSRVLYKNFQFPLNIVVFEDNSRLGYFDYRHYELGISKKLMYLAFDDVIKNIIRHELLHYIAFLILGADIGHGTEFKKLSQQLNWGDEVYSAYSNINEENLKINNPQLKNIELMNKIKKLLSLAASDNVHESELATSKANKLLLDYNLSLLDLTQKDDQEICVQRVLEASKKNAKHLAIYEILKTFYISPVFNHGKGIFYLEIVGTLENVEIASYVAHFLDQELDRQWKMAQKTNPNLKGIVAKNSFFRGLAKGYVEKIQSATKETQLQFSKEIVLIEKSLRVNLSVVYSRLGSSYSKDLKNDQVANKLGHHAGLNLSINPGLKNNSQKKLLLGF